MSNNLFSVNVYQINSQDAIPLANVQKIGFPGAGVMINVANDSSGNPGALLSTGVRTYGSIQVIGTGSKYLTLETQASLLTLANT